MIKRNIDVTANKGQKDERSLTVQVDFPSNLEEAIKTFSGDIVFEKFQDAFDVALQAFVRQQMNKTGEKRLTNEAIIKAVKDWKPSTRKSPDPAKKAETISKLIGTMSPQDRAKLLRELAAQK